MPPPPPASQPGRTAPAAGVDDGPDLGPEFSHLSAEERRQIQMVMARASQMTDDRLPHGYVYIGYVRCLYAADVSQRNIA